MNMRLGTGFAILALTGTMLAVACGDDETETTPTTTTPPSECEIGCTDLYNCGTGICTDADWTSGDLTLDAFLSGQNNDGCVAGCEQNQALLQVIDPDNCATTIGTVAALNSDFNESCFGGGTGGGGAGGSGTGGSGTGGTGTGGTGTGGTGTGGTGGGD